MDERWTLKLDGETKTFATGDELLRHVKARVGEALAQARVLRAPEIRDSDGHRYDITLNLGLEPREGA